MHTTFILDVFHREIVGWQVTNHMLESPARDALPMALVAKYRAGEAVSGLVHHRDRGIRFRSTRYVETLAESEIVASVGSRGDCLLSGYYYHCSRSATHRELSFTA